MEGIPEDFNGEHVSRDQCSSHEWSSGCSTMVLRLELLPPTRSGSWIQSRASDDVQTVDDFIGEYMSSILRESALHHGGVLSDRRHLHREPFGSSTMVSTSRMALSTILFAALVAAVSALAPIAPGDKIPNVDLHWGFNPVTKVNLPSYTAQQSVLIVGLPGAFTPT